MSTSGFAPAKVNLYLHVTGRRADGYHLLDSLCVFAGVGDTLRVTPADDLSLHIEGPFAAQLAAEADNLILLAARRLARAAGVEPAARIVLDKALPVASGIGGGSADAAAALRALSELWGVTLPAAQMQTLALRLGADVPACLASVPARMEGVGEVLSAAPMLPPFGLVLVNPGMAVPTQAVFRAYAEHRIGYSPRANLPARWTSVPDMIADLSVLENDLQYAASRLCPPVDDALAALRAQPDVLLARMSGSGATCFGICADAQTAARVAAACARPGWWSWGGNGGFTHGG